MIQIRHGTFGTNSSSTHSLTLCTNDEYTKWQQGEYLYYTYCDKELRPWRAVVEDLIKRYKNSKLNHSEDIKLLEKVLKEATSTKDWSKIEVEEYNQNFEIFAAKEYDLYTENAYNELLEYETFYDTYNTPNGEKVIAFGYYGYDG